MSSSVSSLLRIVPVCDVAKCRRNGTVYLTITHPKRPVQTASICAQHLPAMLARVQDEGYAVKVTDRASGHVHPTDPLSTGSAKVVAQDD